MKLIFNLLLAVCLSACSLSPSTPQKDIIKDVHKRKSTIVIDSALKLQYHAKGEYYVMDFITIGENHITFNKKAAELITIHIRYVGEKGAIIGKDYHFNNDTHQLSHFYSIKNNHLHGFAVFYNDARKVERYEYFNEGESGHPQLTNANSIDKVHQEVFSDSLFHTLFLQPRHGDIYKSSSMEYYKTRDKRILFIGSLCFVVKKEGTLEAIFTHCYKCNNKLFREGEGYFFDPHSRYLIALGHYKHNTPNRKAILFDNNGMIIQHK